MLPQNVSLQSRELLKVAKQLISTYSLDLADAIIVIGSVSRGKADRFSDLDVTFLLEEYPAIQRCQQWIETYSVTELRPIRTLSDNQIWMEYQYQEYKLNFKWQSWDSLDSIMQLVRDFSSGEIAMPQGEFMLMHWIIYHAIALRDHPRLQKLKAEVKIYPENLRRKIIENILSIWEWMSNVPVLFAAYDLAVRGEIIDLKRRQLMGLNSILRVLFAYNRLWQPDEKWLMSEIETMPLKPDRFKERIHFVLTNEDVLESLRENFRLMIDTMALLKNEFDVDNLISTIQAIADYKL